MSKDQRKMHNALQTQLFAFLINDFPWLDNCGKGTTTQKQLSTECVSNKSADKTKGKL